MLCGLKHMFFFSNRRRHTRYWRDWSSDVCSSDLSFQKNHGLSADGMVGANTKAKLSSSNICQSSSNSYKSNELQKFINIAETQLGITETGNNITKYGDRKSTRLNSSHANISYAVFCLKKKKKIINIHCTS